MPQLMWNRASVYPISSKGPPHSVVFTTHKGVWRTYSNSDPHGW
jgi:hypothetical protein